MVSLEEQVETLQARIAELEAMLGQGDKKLSTLFGLPPRMSNLLGLLMAVEVATPDMIQHKLEIATDTKVAMHRLRAYMEPFNVKVHSKRGVGYWLDEDTKSFLRGVLTQEVTDGD